MIYRSLAVLFLSALPTLAWASPVVLPNTFQNGTVADADQVNANYVALSDGVNDNDTRLLSLEALPHPWSTVGLDLFFATGWVGIGNTQPQATLHLSDTTPPRIRFDHDHATPQIFQLSAGSDGFHLDSITFGRRPFSIATAARSNSIVIDDDGRVGLGTASPAADLHVVTGQGAALRLEQDGSWGLTPQTWEVRGDEAGFFVSDLTNGGTQPFAVEAGAPTNALVVTNFMGNVGFGTSMPTNALHIQREDAIVRLENTNATVAARNLLYLQNNGPVGLLLTDLDTSHAWNVLTDSAGSLIISKQSTGATEMWIDSAGNLTTFGTINGVSDVREKRDVAVLANPLEMLEALHGYSYSKRATGQKEVGVLAQEVEAVLPELVRTDEKGMKSVAYGNLVALLIEVNHAQEKKMALLEDRVAELEAPPNDVDLLERVERLEALLSGQR